VPLRRNVGVRTTVPWLKRFACYLGRPATSGSTPPPSTLLGVGVVGYDVQLVEVEAIAALP
jgi:hypothetical protein